MATNHQPVPGAMPPSGGMRGEMADNSDVERPELRRTVGVEGTRQVTVEESSGTAYAEAAGLSGLVAPAPDPGVSAVASPPAAPDYGWAPPAPPAQSKAPALLAAALLGGLLLVLLSGSSRKRRAPERRDIV